MANEIMVLEGDGSNRYDLLFLFPIASPAQVNGSNASPANTAALRGSTELPLVAQSLLSVAEKLAIDDGTVGWEIFGGFLKQPGLTNQQLLSMIQEFYALAADAFATKYDSIFQHIGARLDAS